MALNFLSMEFPNVQFVKISALNFTNCGRADFSNVNSLGIDNCNFFCQPSWSLNDVSNVPIVRSLFLNGKASPVLHVVRSSLFVKFSMFINTTGDMCEGAAIKCEMSFLKVEQTKFLQNRVIVSFLVLVVRYILIPQM